MSEVEITEVRQSQSAGGWLSYLESPLPGSTGNRTTVEISGWVFGRDVRAQEVQVLARDELIRAIPVNVPRPDVKTAHPEAPETSGFWSLCGTLGLERDFTLSIDAVMTDGSRLELGSVSGRREPIVSSFEPGLRPLLVTSLGRTGTTLLLGVLSAHPAIVAYRTHPFEVFPARYWLHLLQVLAEPADHTRSSHPSTFAQDLWRVGYNPFHSPPATHEPELADFLGRTYVDRLTGFCQESIEAFYEIVARMQGQTSAQFFVEKFQPDRLPRIAWELYPRMKEIVLVRDFRDVICSVLAFNTKRGTTEFGREGFETDADYVRFVGQRASRLVDAWRSRRDRSELVRYRDFVRHPAETLERLLAYLELDPHPAIVERMIRTGFNHPDANYHRTTATIEESIDRWKRDLPASLRPVVRESLDAALGELGYEPT